MKTPSSLLARVASCVFAGAFLLSAVASAGYVYTMHEGASGEEGAGASVRILADGGKVKFSNLGDVSADMVYDAKRNAMTMIDHREKRYMEIDQATVRRISEQIKRAMEQYEQALASAPPAQREMMERMMKERMPQLGAAERVEEVEVRETDETKEVGGYEARLFEVAEDGRKARELWVAPWSSVPGSEDVAEAFEGMSSLFGEMVRSFSEGPLGGLFARGMESSWLAELKSVAGFPVLTREFDGAGQLVSETKLGAVEQREFDGSEFEPPEGYRRQNLDMGR